MAARKPSQKTKAKYREEYKKFQSSEKQKKARARRNRDRAKAEKAGKVKKGDNLHVDHSDGFAKGRVRVIPASKNLWKKEKSRLKGSKRKKR